MNKVKNWIRRILLVVCICVFCYSAYNLISIYLDYKKIDDDYGKIESTYVKETETKEGQAYLDIDWDSLLKRNSDVKAWIQIPDTKVNYPVLQGETNDTYIHSDIDKKSFRAGCIFIDSNNQNPFQDINTVIYGHNMKNGSMFNNIKSYHDQDFANKHPYIYIYFPNGTVSQYKVVASHIISQESVLYNTQIQNIPDFYQEMLKNSKIKVDFDQNQQTPVITLSTCVSGDSNNEQRNVVHALLNKANINPKEEKME
ncbi:MULTISPECIES: class B sortase [Coprobacillaceae]|uniref:class B sortase n=1 Tax=Coprobacillaceae TaxID=2810280 RepID=UPI000E4B2DCD|nr:MULTISPECIES: class B sortase [Coprobacillaceae]RHM61905.1 SrtB family sortase [Coprobacillus sp. AF33-1AC]RHS94668.1 SrtB family sortase [Erysipelatoclostridium sp. AM42-17]